MTFKILRLFFLFFIRFEAHAVESTAPREYATGDPQEQLTLDDSASSGVHAEQVSRHLIFEDFMLSGPHDQEMQRESILEDFMSSKEYAKKVLESCRRIIRFFLEKDGVQKNEAKKCYDENNKAVEHSIPLWIVLGEVQKIFKEYKEGKIKPGDPEYSFLSTNLDEKETIRKLRDFLVPDMDAEPITACIESFLSDVKWGNIETLEENEIKKVLENYGRWNAFPLQGALFLYAMDRGEKLDQFLSAYKKCRQVIKKSSPQSEEDQSNRSEEEKFYLSLLERAKSEKEDEFLIKSIEKTLKFSIYREGSGGYSFHWTKDHFYHNPEILPILENYISLHFKGESEEYRKKRDELESRVLSSLAEKELHLNQ